MKFGKAVSIVSAFSTMMVGANGATVEFQFPPTETAEFVHGLCVLGGASATVANTDPDVSYVTEPEPFGNDIKLWADRDYVTAGVQGAAMCEGGMYLQPSHHKSIDRGSVSRLTVTAADPHQPVTICGIAEHLIVVEYDPRTAGNCGRGAIGSNGLCPSGCCSRYGWCGWNEPWCGTHGTCGNGNRGNKICLDQTACCSTDGYCGHTQQHCTGSTGGRLLLESEMTPIEEMPRNLTQVEGREAQVEGREESFSVTPFEMAVPAERILLERAGGWEDALPHDGFTVSEAMSWHGYRGRTYYSEEMRVFCKEFPPVCPQPSHDIACATEFNLATCTLEDRDATQCTYSNLCEATSAGFQESQCSTVRSPETPAPTRPTPTSYGDPHFVAWSGEAFDFHGGCDLVLLENPGFANGLGLNVHIRTNIKTWWSHIKSAAVQIGDHTLEIMASTGSSSYWINGGDEIEFKTGDATIGDFPVHFKVVNDHHTIARVDLGNGDAIGVETFKDFVRVNIKDKSQTAFQGSVGLLGAYENGSKVGRDGKTVFDNTDEFGQEWMVRAADTLLFHDMDAAQLPLVCAMPDETTIKEGRRRLAEASISEEDAGLACARVTEGIHRDACIFDVMATQDKEMAGSY